MLELGVGQAEVAFNRLRKDPEIWRSRKLKM
jgi:hypothetical protein